MVLRETVRPADVQTRKISLLLYPSLPRFLHDDYNRRVAGLVSIPIQNMASSKFRFEGWIFAPVSTRFPRPFHARARFSGDLLIVGRN